MAAGYLAANRHCITEVCYKYRSRCSNCKTKVSGHRRCSISYRCKIITYSRSPHHRGFYSWFWSCAMILGYRRDFASQLWKSAYRTVWCNCSIWTVADVGLYKKPMLYHSSRMHDAVVSKLIATSRGSPCDSMASCYTDDDTHYTTWLSRNSKRCHSCVFVVQ